MFALGSKKEELKLTSRKIKGNIVYQMCSFIPWRRTITPLKDIEQYKSNADKRQSEPEIDDFQSSRLEALSSFQVSSLLHALSFPSLERLVYSTCSVHAAENEEVIKKVIVQAKQMGWSIGHPFKSWHRRGKEQYQHDGIDCEKFMRVDPFQGDESEGFFLVLFLRSREYIDNEMTSTKSHRPAPERTKRKKKSTRKKDANKRLKS